MSVYEEAIKHCGGCRMTLEELEKYRKQICYIRSLEDEIREVERLYLPGKEHPESGKSSVFSPSSPVEKHFQRMEDLREKLARQKEAALLQLLHIEDWLDTVEDPLIKAIIKGRYICGYSWGKVAQIFYGGGADRTTPQQALKRYMERCS